MINKSKLGIKYNKIVKEIEGALDFVMASSDIKNKDNYINNLYTSHESLILDYEKLFFKKFKNHQFCCSSHMLWVGDRTRYINSEHLDFVSKLDNPIGIKIGPKIKIDDIPAICSKVNPQNEQGKLIFIVRLGEKNIEKMLPKIIEKVKYYGHEIIWFCDPMHGNTIKSQNGYKTRQFKTIINELESFFNIHMSSNTIPGGVHIELTGENVTECLGGINDIKDKDLDLRYETACDPRLNNEQSLEIAFLISKLIKQRKIMDSKVNIKGYGDDLTINNIRIGDLSPEDHEKIEKKHGGNNYSPLEDVVVSHVKDSSTLICRKPSHTNIEKYIESELLDGLCCYSAVNQGQLNQTIVDAVIHHLSEEKLPTVPDQFVTNI